MLKVCVAAKLLTMFYRKVVVKQTSRLVILEHSVFNMGFLPFKSWNLKRLDVGKRSFLGEAEFLVETLFRIIM